MFIYNQVLKLRKLAYLWGIMLFLLTASIDLFGQDYKARIAAETACLAAWAQDFSCRSYYDKGKLKKGQKYIITKTFYSGTHYALIAAGDDYAKDIDIFVYDVNENLIGYDRKSDKEAIVSFYPRYTGTYYVVISMANSYGTPYWILMTTYK